MSVEIEGYTAAGGGGGGSGVTGGTFYTSLDYVEIPTGKLTVNVSNLLLVKDRLTWKGSGRLSAAQDRLGGGHAGARSVPDRERYRTA